MFNIILHQPEIPPNTGNIIRLSANSGARLHLVQPLGFQLNERTLTRAGMDYREIAEVCIHEDWQACIAALGECRLFAATTRGATRYDTPRYAAGDAFIFGAETRGLPQSLLDSIPQSQHIRIPMRTGNRSINLSNAVAVVVYEAWRQCGFEGGT